MITDFGVGNAMLANLPRKINIGLSPSRDDFPHTFINDVGLVAVKHPVTGEVKYSPDQAPIFEIHAGRLHGCYPRSQAFHTRSGCYV